MKFVCISIIGSLKEVL